MRVCVCASMCIRYKSGSVYMCREVCMCLKYCKSIRFCRFTYSLYCYMLVYFFVLSSHLYSSHAIHTIVCINICQHCCIISEGECTKHVHTHIHTFIPFDSNFGSASSSLFLLFRPESDCVLVQMCLCARICAYLCVCRKQQNGLRLIRKPTKIQKTYIHHIMHTHTYAI